MSNPVFGKSNKPWQWYVQINRVGVYKGRMLCIPTQHGEINELFRNSLPNTCDVRAYRPGYHHGHNLYCLLVKGHGQKYSCLPRMWPQGCGDYRGNHNGTLEKPRRSQKTHPAADHNRESHRSLPVWVLRSQMDTLVSTHGANWETWGQRLEIGD